MTSLKHGVNLSRRACRRAIALVAAVVLLPIAHPNPIEVSGFFIILKFKSIGFL